jgi:hypothetical protein
MVKLPFIGEIGKKQDDGPTLEDTTDDMIHEDYDAPARPMDQAFPREPIELSAFMVQHTPFTNSKYHKWLTKELATSNIRREDMLTLRMDERLIAYSEYLDLPEMAKDYHFDVEWFLQTSRSIDGFERKQQSTLTQNIRKSVAEDRGGGGFLGKR